MYDEEINWLALLPLPLLLGLLFLLAEIGGVWPGRSIRPDIIWCLAYFAGRRAIPVLALTAAAYCGLAHDLLLGPKLGAATLAYILVAWLFMYWREEVAGGGFLEHTVLLGVLAIIVNLLRTILEVGDGFLEMWSEYLIVAVVSGIVTAVVYPLFYVLFSLPGFDPTRRRKWGL